MIFAMQHICGFKDRIFAHLKTLWLFTYSDLKAIVIPSTAFAALTVLSGPILTTNPDPGVLRTVTRVPQMVLWIWINLLPFTTDNQRQARSILEDVANKPWRPMPSQRLSKRAALRLTVCGYFLAVMTSVCLGGLFECILLMALGVWYNQLGGSDVNCCLKNFINACGITLFALGTTRVATQGHLPASLFNPVAKYWFLVVATVILTSIQTQDMYDQTGDRIRGRKTLPLVVGDLAARKTIAFAVCFWSVLCPIFWGLRSPFLAVSIAFGTFIAFRTLSRHSVAADKKTFWFWNLWMIMLYSMPLVKRYTSRVLEV